MAENPCKTNMDYHAAPPNHSQTISNTPVEEAVHVLWSIWPSEAPISLCEGHALLKTTLHDASPSRKNENNSTTSTPKNGKLVILLLLCKKQCRIIKLLQGDSWECSMVAGLTVLQLASCNTASPELGDKSSSTSVLTNENNLNNPPALKIQATTDKRALNPSQPFQAMQCLQGAQIQPKISNVSPRSVCPSSSVQTKQ